MKKLYFRSFAKRAISLGISLIIVVAIYSRVDFVALGKIIISVQPVYLFLALTLLGTHFLLSGWRWRVMAGPDCPFSFSESTRFIIACSPLNVIFPVKTGSFGKAFFMKEKGYAELKPSIAMALYEKFTDLAALSLIFVFSFLLMPGVNILTLAVLAAASFFLIFYFWIHLANLNSFMQKALWKKYAKIKIVKILYEGLCTAFGYLLRTKGQKTRLWLVNLISVIIWLNSIIQFVFFFKMFRFQVPVSAIFLNIPCAIFIGLLPISISGIGTRDAAIIYLFRGILSYNEAVSIGILSVLRYVIPALIGLPFLNMLMFDRNNNVSLTQNMEY